MSMILIEIFSDSSKQLFLNVPDSFHKKLMNLYIRSIISISNKLLKLVHLNLLE